VLRCRKRRIPTHLAPKERSAPAPARQSQLEAGAAERGVEHPRRPAVGGGHRPHEGEAEAGAPRAAGPSLVEPGEALEDPLALGGGHAGAVVVHDDHRVAAVEGDADGDRRAGVTGGVVDQVAHGAAERGAVTTHACG